MTAAIPQGKWLLVRSDRYVISIDSPDTPYVLGRSRGLPEAQILNSNYVSRAQISVVQRGPHLYVSQVGKNPTFYSVDCMKVPGSSSASTTDAAVNLGTTMTTTTTALEYHADASIAAPAAAAACASTTASSVIIRVPCSDPVRAAAAPSRAATPEATTLHFPDELGLPTITIRFEIRGTMGSTPDASAATTTLSVQQMLAVPTNAGGYDDEDENEVGVTGNKAESDTQRQQQSGVPSQWQGLLDIAMQQQKQEAQQQKQQQPTTALQKVTPVALVPAPAKPISVEVPFGTPQPAKPANPAPITDAVAATALVSGAPAAVATPAKPQQKEWKMGFWEWKARANGKDSDPRSWKKYPLAVAKLLEEAYKAGKTHVSIPNSLMGNGTGAIRSDQSSESDGEKDSSKATYAVCFCERSLDGAMIQYQLNDKGRFRMVRRSGGDEVNRKGIKGIRVIPEESSSDSDDYYDESSSDEESCISLSDSDSEEDEPPKKKKKKGHGRK